MAISTKNFATLVSDMVAAVQGQATALIDFRDGGIIKSIIQSVGGCVLWLQGVVLQVAALTRLSTSTGADVDSFVNDYGYYRLGAVAATDTVTFSRFTPTAQAVIPPGANVGTNDGSQAFTVTEDPSNPAWSGSLGGYVIPGGTASITGIPVQAVTPGAAGNVVASAIGLILSAIPGVDTVTNPTPAAGGADAETDAQVRAGFQLFLAALASGTKAAITFVIGRVQAGLASWIGEGVNLDLSSHPGFLTIVVDDGTGSPPSSLLQAVYTAVDTTRACGIAYGVFGPTTLAANVVMQITAGIGFSPSTVVAAVQSAISIYIAGLTLGQGLSYEKLSQLAFDASNGVASIVPGYTLNGAEADLAAIGSQKIVEGTITVTHT